MPNGNLAFKTMVAASLWRIRLGTSVGLVYIWGWKKDANTWTAMCNYTVLVS